MEKCFIQLASWNVGGLNGKEYELAEESQGLYIWIEQNKNERLRTENT